MAHPLTEFREARGWTLGEAADRFGVTKATVSRWESGSRKPDPETAVDLDRKQIVPREILRPDL